MQEEASRRLREWETKLKEEADKKAQEILALAIQRCASEVVSGDHRLSRSYSQR